MAIQMKVYCVFIDKSTHTVNQIMIDWNDRNAVKQFAYQANIWLRKAPGNSVLTIRQPENIGISIDPFNIVK